MARTDRIPVPVGETRNRARAEHELSERYYDRVRAELRMQRGLI